MYGRLFELDQEGRQIQISPARNMSSRQGMMRPDVMTHPSEDDVGTSSIGYLSSCFKTGGEDTLAAGFLYNWSGLEALFLPCFGSFRPARGGKPARCFGVLGPLSLMSCGEASFPRHLVFLWCQAGAGWVGSLWISLRSLGPFGQGAAS